MAIIPGQACEDCAERGKETPAEHELDSCGDGSGGGGFVCGNCYSNRGESAYERFLDDYYGGSGPVTLDEHYQAAARERRELRSKD